MSKTIGLACNISTGKLDANAAVSSGKYPFFTCAEHPDQIDHFAYDDDVVLIAGNNARGNFHINRFKGKFNAYQRTYILTAKEGFNIDYIYYALKLELKRLREKSQGSQTKFLTMPILTGIHFPSVTDSKQAEIANVLTALDTKIELNNRINTELEAMAKTLYDYWFVQFDFPDANGKPYKSSGGKMVYNAKLKREIPEDWEIAPLGNHISFTRGISYKSMEIGDSGVPFINLNSFYLDGSFKFEGTKYYSGPYKEEQQLDNGALVVAITDVTRNADIIGRAFIIYNTFEQKPLISCDVATVKSNNLNAFYLERLFNSDSYHSYIKHFASGTLVLHLNLNGMLWYDTFIPPNKLLNEFESFCQPLQKQKEQILKENKQLEQLREWLLPMLMNGQVTVA